MSCLTKFIKDLISKIIFIAIIVAYFAFGGFTKTKEAINNYQNPTRSEFIQTEQSYADFSCVSSDFQLSRSFNLLGYKKINAKYLPTGEKIVVIDLKNDDKISPKDFENREIDRKITSILNKTKDSVVTFEDFTIVERGHFATRNATIPFVRYEAKVKNLPFKYVSGVIACYASKGNGDKPTVKVVSTIVDRKAFNIRIIQSFIASLRI